jgi:hypothetical protein
MLLVTTAVFGIGAVQKAPCANRGWVERHQGISFVCDSDVPNLLLWEQLQDGRIPYLDPCRTTDRPCDEYPPVTMFVMRAISPLAQSGGDPYARFYWGSALFLLACALATTWTLERLQARTVLFAAAPILAVAGTANWDLLPVALASGATLAYLRRRDAVSGVLLGLGAAAKLYPGLLVIPFVEERRRERAADGGIRLLVGAIGSWLLTNLPFVVFAFGGWFTFFRYNGPRGADYSSVWAVVCRWLICPSPRTIDVLSACLIVIGTTICWRLAVRSSRSVPRWVMGFPLIVMFVLTGKVWAAHYALWLLPWFALTAVPALYVIEYQLAEVAAYLVTYHYFGTVITGTGIPYGVLALIVILRAILLVRCLVVWIHDPDPVSPLAVPTPSRQQTPGHPGSTETS